MLQEDLNNNKSIDFGLSYISFVKTVIGIERCLLGFEAMNTNCQKIRAKPTNHMSIALSTF